jgi:hypothetical protein
MEYKEAPCIQSVSRKVVFPVIRWLDKRKFLEYQENNTPIYPFLNDDNTNSKTYVGKSIQNCLDEGVRYGHDYRLNNSKIINLEIIGSVLQDATGKWVLQVAHSSSVCEIKQDFLVLCIDDPDSFKWVRTKGGIPPKYSFKACIDRLTSEYFYVGKPNSSDAQVKPEFFSNMKWNKYNEDIPYSVFGKVHVSHKCLYVPHNGIELSFSTFDILALKPSPSSLKILCRTRIRELLNNSQDKILEINKSKSGRKYVPEPLIKFIAFPSQLTVGEYMLRGEKIVRQDGHYELTLLKDGNLVCRSLITKQEEKELALNNELIDRIDHQITNTICSDVDSLWLHRFQVAIYKTNTKVRVEHSFYDTSPEYKLIISVKDKPNFEIESC